MGLMNYGQPMQPLNRRNHSSGTTAQSLSQSVTQPLNKPTYPLRHPNQGKPTYPLRHPNQGKPACSPCHPNQGKQTNHCIASS